MDSCSSLRKAAAELPHSKSRSVGSNLDVGEVCALGESNPFWNSKGDPHGHNQHGSSDRLAAGVV
jgi:hypothetical protein